MFEDRDVNFQIGEGSSHGIVEGLEIALLKFKKKEKSLIMLKAPYAFKDAGKEDFNIPPSADVQYEVTMNNFEKVCLFLGTMIDSQKDCATLPALFQIWFHREISIL